MSTLSDVADRSIGRLNWADSGRWPNGGRVHDSRRTRDAGEGSVFALSGVDGGFAGRSEGGTAVLFAPASAVMFLKLGMIPEPRSEGAVPINRTVKWPVRGGCAPDWRWPSAAPTSQSPGVSRTRSARIASRADQGCGGRAGRAAQRRTSQSVGPAADVAGCPWRGAGVRVGPNRSRPWPETPFSRKVLVFMSPARRKRDVGAAVANGDRK